MQFNRLILQQKQMRKLYLSLFLLLPILADAQYAKYELVEWFTNTYCPICSSRNPALRTVYNESNGKLHRITIHPSVPYPQCPLYNFNKEDNGARQQYYGVSGTPSLYINGIRSSNSASVFESDLNQQEGLQSPVAVVVTEETSANRSTTIKISVAGEVPEGDYRLFVALVEQSVDLVANNGETDHLDVLRSFISSNEGDEFEMPSVGGELTVSYDYDIPDGVRPDEAYVVAFIQDINSKLILNSGTRFDEVVTSLADITVESGLKVFPNPVNDQITLSVANKYLIDQVEIYSYTGQKIRVIPYSTPERETTIQVNDLAPGTYMVIANIGREKGVIQFIKE